MPVSLCCCLSTEGLCDILATQRLAAWVSTLALAKLDKLSKLVLACNTKKVAAAFMKAANDDDCLLP